MPIEGTAGRIWRTAIGPARLLAPVVSMASRVAKAEFWVETSEEEFGPGPRVELTEWSDVQHPREGAGPLNHRRYRVHIANPTRTPTGLMSEFRHRPNDFSPTSFATFDPPPGPAGMVVGDELTVRLPGPWDGPVIVTEAGPRAVVLGTRNGHMEAGWIRFETFEDGGVTIFEIESLARSGDRVFDALYHAARIGKLLQTEMWTRVLEAAVQISGGQLIGRPTVHTIIHRGAE